MVRWGRLLPVVGVAAGAALAVAPAAGAQPGSAPSVPGRDSHQWPFAWDSIWNLPPDIDSDQMHGVFAKLNVITNNAERTPGGGTLTVPRTAERAAAFTDGTGGAPAHCGAAQ